MVGGTEGALEVLPGALGLAAQPHLPQTDRDRHVVGAKLEGAPVGLDGLLVAAVLVEHHAEMVGGLEIVGLDRQDVAVAGLGRPVEILDVVAPAELTVGRAELGRARARHSPRARRVATSTRSARRGPEDSGLRMRGLRYRDGLFPAPGPAAARQRQRHRARASAARRARSSRAAPLPHGRVGIHPDVGADLFDAPVGPADLDALDALGIARARSGRAGRWPIRSCRRPAPAASARRRRS